MVAYLNTRFYLLGIYRYLGNRVEKTAGSLDKTTYTLQISCTDGLLTTADTFTVTVTNTVRCRDDGHWRYTV